MVPIRALAADCRRLGHFTGLSFNDAAHVFHKAIVQELAQASHQRLGDLVLAAQEDYAATGAYPEMLSIYHTFGDPALRVR